MKMKLVLAGMGILLLGAALTGWYLFNKPHAGVDGLNAQVTTDALSLYTEFEKNETLATGKYLNKIIRVTGKVSGMQQTSSSQIIVLGDENSAGGISCKLASAPAQKDIVLEKSSVVTLKGRCSGYLMDVNLVDCVIEPPIIPK